MENSFFIIPNPDNRVQKILEDANIKLSSVVSRSMGKDVILQDAGSMGNYRINLPCIIGRSNDSGLILSDHAISHKHALNDDSCVALGH